MELEEPERRKGQGRRSRGTGGVTPFGAMTSDNELPGPYGSWESKLAEWGAKAGL